MQYERLVCTLPHFCTSYRCSAPESSHMAHAHPPALAYLAHQSGAEGSGATDLCLTVRNLSSSLQDGPAVGGAEAVPGRCMAREATASALFCAAPGGAVRHGINLGSGGRRGAKKNASSSSSSLSWTSIAASVVELRRLPAVATCKSPPLLPLRIEPWPGSMGPGLLRGCKTFFIPPTEGEARDSRPVACDWTSMCTSATISTWRATRSGIAAA